MKEKLQLNTLSSLQGGWESVNGNPDVYIFQGYDGGYYLLVYNYDKDYGRGSFSCYEIGTDEKGYYIRMGMSSCRLVPEEKPDGLHISGWESYIKN
ncbi:DUF3876 domain-containing protein [Massilibacteroides sp.]|uniref:DUF3876 domain-containing protein n=1 Tax=Massilibacteroides sp. TaxID=2034766 RepID=UPI00262F5680|nr:DUF3876 domain-containing protein [Massilibacteroides sp.]MDD4516883.1 DUF3876 domain-containing protein [Massilibacteroides sp.]